MLRLRNIAELPITLFGAIILLGSAYRILELIGVPLNFLPQIFTASAIFTGVLVAYRGFELSSKAHQDPWFVSFRDLHKEFWDDDKLKCVRIWICSDQEYMNVLLPVLEARKNGTVDANQYEHLESIDRYCALMIRVCLLRDANMTEEQIKTFQTLGYDAWLQKTKERVEIYRYIEKHWKHLAERMRHFEPTRETSANEASQRTL